MSEASNEMIQNINVISAIQSTIKKMKINLDKKYGFDSIKL